MRARQLNAQEREQLRRQRSETNLILARYKELGFEYVVNPPIMPKVAFGSTLHRDVMPVNGPSMTGLMRRLMPEYSPGPSPLDYDCTKPIGFKYPSNAGFSALANKMPRLPVVFEDVKPPVGAHDFPPYPLPAGFTFDKQKAPEPTSITPGASTYSIQKKYPNYKMETAFGSCRLVWPAVAVFCGPNNSAVCVTCHERPIGDYFHSFAGDKDMCRDCMNTELAAIKQCSLGVSDRYRRRQNVKLFVPARYCGFYHEHNGTTAAVELFSRKELRHKIRVENYLYRFQSKVE